MMVLKEFLAVYNRTYDVTPPRGPITSSQKSFFLIGISALIFWLYGKLKWIFYERDLNQSNEIQNDVIIDVSEKQHVNSSSSQANVTSNTRQINIATFDDALKSVVAIFLVLLYYFFCDYLHIFPKADRIYNRDLFIFLVLLLFIVSIVFTKTVSTTGDTNSVRLLNREQTEEWKGWMQVMFVWYHYFRAVETYNAIRIFIASYVWMTGFGNFSFFWVRKDFSLRRILNSLFRLNFLVILTTVATNNEYMLYYICAMHTFWYFSVYLMMRPFYQYNENPKVMFIKFTVYFVVVFIVFDVPGVSSVIFKPFQFILGYNGSLHEWVFRSTLDHYATLVGMLCAYFHPNFEVLLKKLTEHRFERLILGLIVLILFGVNLVWYKTVYVLDKYSYNNLHPYTFFIPLLSYIFFRNSTANLRRCHCSLFTFLGKITLETYISQLHIYLQKDAKSILVYIPNYPLLNFLLNSIIYIHCSNHLFRATVLLNQYIFPSNAKKMWRNIAVIFVIIVTSYLLVYISEWRLNK